MENKKLDQPVEELANKIINQLDDYATSVDGECYGLPVYSPNLVEGMQGIVKKIFNEWQAQQVVSVGALLDVGKESLLWGEVHEEIMQARIKIWKMKDDKNISLAAIDDILSDLATNTPTKAINFIKSWEEATVPKKEEEYKLTDNDWRELQNQMNIDTLEMTKDENALKQIKVILDNLTDEERTELFSNYSTIPMKEEDNPDELGMFGQSKRY